MKKAGVCVLLLFVLFAGVLQARTWHYGKFTYKGEFLEMKTIDGEETVRVKQDSDGKVKLLKWKYLSEADRAYVQQQTQASKTVGDGDATPAAASNSKGMEVVENTHRHALLIGVNEYPNEPKLLCKLPSSAKDMRDIADVLVEFAGFQRENIVLMTDDSTEDALKPTCQNIRAQVEKMKNSLSKGDLLLVAFSGHGVVIDLQDETKPRAYLCSQDTSLKDLNTLIDRTWLFDTLDQCPAERKILLFDACRNEFTKDKIDQLASKSGTVMSVKSMTDPS